MPRSLHSDRYRRLCQLLADARRKKGLTQTDLAAALGKPQSYVSKYENGERRLDPIELVDIAKVLDCRPAALLRDLEGKN